MKDIIALNICQMQHLEELGIDIANARLELMLHPSFLLQDIIELLPEYIPVNDEQSYDSEAELFINKCSCRYVYRDCEGYPLYTGSENNYNNVLESAYNLLCWCAENGYLKNNKTE